MLNKIDLPSAQPEKYAAELAHIIGCDPGDVLRVSAKTGEGSASCSTRSSAWCRTRSATRTRRPER